MHSAYWHGAKGAPPHQLVFRACFSKCKDQTVLYYFAIFWIRNWHKQPWLQACKAHLGLGRRHLALFKMNAALVPCLFFCLKAHRRATYRTNKPGMLSLPPSLAMIAASALAAIVPARGLHAAEIMMLRVMLAKDNSIARVPGFVSLFGTARPQDSLGWPCDSDPSVNTKVPSTSFGGFCQCNQPWVKN